MAERGMQRLDGWGVERVFAYLDNDAAGRTGLDRLVEHTKWQVRDESGLYMPFKDVNEWHVDREPSRHR